MNNQNKDLVVVEVSYEETINTGNYENIKIKAALKINSPRDRIKATYDKAFARVKEEVEIQKELAKQYR